MTVKNQLGTPKNPALLQYDDTYLVTKWNPLIEETYKLTALEQKVIAVIASNIEPDDTDFKTYTFSIRKFLELIGSKSKNFAPIRKITKSLISKGFEVEVEEVDKITGKVKKKLVQVSWLSDATYRVDEGTITVRFSPELKPFFLELSSNFTKFRLGNVVRLRSGYSIRLYELLKKQEHFSKHRRFELTELREKLGCADKYPYWNNFKQRVLETAQREFKEFTDLEFTFETEKGPRNVVEAVIFHISENEGSIKEKIEKESEFQMRKMQDVITTDDTTDNPAKAWAETQLTSLRMKKKEIKALLETYDDIRLVKNIEYSFEEFEKKDIRYKAAYVRKAILNDYAKTQEVETEHKSIDNSEELNAPEKSPADSQKTSIDDNSLVVLQGLRDLFGFEDITDNTLKNWLTKYDSTAIVSALTETNGKGGVESPGAYASTILKFGGIGKKGQTTKPQETRKKIENATPENVPTKEEKELNKFLNEYYKKRAEERNQAKIDSKDFQEEVEKPLLFNALTEMGYPTEELEGIWLKNQKIYQLQMDLKQKYK